MAKKMKIEKEMTDESRSISHVVEMKALTSKMIVPWQNNDPRGR